MKKFLALALAIVMMMAMAVPAFAAEKTITQANDATADPDPVTADNQGKVNVTYTVSETYTVSIPADITLTAEAAETLSLSASEVRLAGNQTLKVTISSTQYDSGWFLEDSTGASEKVAYTIENDTVVVDDQTVNDVVNNAIVLTATTPAEADPAATTTEVLTLNTDGTAQVGTYTDTLTFTVAVVLTSTLGA